MAPRAKRRRRNTSAVTPVTPTLPGDLILEIVARSEPHVLVRCAAACKLLRRDILSPSFLRRVGRRVAPHILLVYPRTRNNDKPFTLVHPATPAAMSFCHGHLFPFLSRRAADGLFDKYSVVTSRNGLVLLERADMTYRTCSIMNRRPNSGRRSGMCVYDAMSGVRTFLSSPPKISTNSISAFRQYVLLTAADGIHCSFQVLVADLNRCSIKMWTASSSCRTWRPVKCCLSKHNFPLGFVQRRRGPVVLHGGVIHWLQVCHDKQILRYDLGRGNLGSVKLPHINCGVNQLHLATSSDGKLLKLLVIEGFMMSVWLQVPVTPADNSSAWSLETVIDMEDKLRLLHPNIHPIRQDEPVAFDGSENWSGDVVLLQVPGPGGYATVTVFDLETNDMHTQKQGSFYLEIDLLSRLKNMKIFS